MNIGDRILELRKKTGISQEELSECIGVSRQAVSKWESGQSMPDIDKIILLSEYFDVTTDYILRGITGETEKKGKDNAIIFNLIATAINFSSLVLAIVIWKHYQNVFALGIGLIGMTIGVFVYLIGRYVLGQYKKVNIYFIMVNIWFLTLIPLSLLFNGISSAIYGYCFILSPIPEITSNYAGVFAWIIYFMMGIAVDVKGYLKLKNKAYR